MLIFFFFSSRRRHTRLQGDWSSDVCSSDLALMAVRGEDAWFAGAMATLAVLAGAVLGLAMGAASGGALGGALGLGVGAVLWRALTSRATERERIRLAPFPGEWRRVLERRYDH